MSFILRHHPKPGFTPALSLWQPWASAMVFGPKNIETRGYPTTYRGPMVLHAAKHWTRAELEFWREIPRCYFGDLPEAPDMLPFGALIALVDLVGCDPVEKIDADNADQFWGNYADGRFGYSIHNVRAFPRPVPFRGLQGFFSVPNAVVEAGLESGEQP